MRQRLLTVMICCAGQEGSAQRHKLGAQHFQPQKAAPQGNIRVIILSTGCIVFTGLCSFERVAVTCMLQLACVCVCYCECKL